MDTQLTRRTIVTRAVPAFVLGRLLASAGQARAQAASPDAGAGFKDGLYVLPPLPYAYDALEPHIDAETMHLHHDKHHKAYVDGLNKAIKELAALDAAGGEGNPPLLTGLQEDLSFNAGGHLLHTLFWPSMGPNAGGQPPSPLSDAITRDFGSVEAFRTHFSRAAAGVKGSGWAILAYEPVGDRLMVLQTKQHDLQLVAGAVPLLPLDVWEHAYYLKYHNVRAEYVKAWWNVVNWDAVNNGLVAARKAAGRA